MWHLSQVIFDLVHVPVIEAPVVIAKGVETRQTITFDPAGHIDVRVEITPDQLAQTAK
jgi:hypothetical protein